MFFEKEAKRLCASARRASKPILLMVLIAFVSFSMLVPVAKALLPRIYSDLSDGMVTQSYGANPSANYMIVGDDPQNRPTRSFVKFSLSGISGPISFARLWVWVGSSFHNGVSWSGIGPLTNPGLGDCRVIHIDDYDVLAFSSFSLPSIGNDPGVLLSSSATPADQGYVYIDVTAAMQDDLINGRSWSTFRIQLDTSTDNDNLEDSWYFYTSNNGTNMPYIEYNLSWTREDSRLPPYGNIIWNGQYDGAVFADLNHDSYADYVFMNSGPTWSNRRAYRDTWLVD